MITLPVPEHPGFEADEDGQVYRDGILLIGYKDEQGYIKVVSGRSGYIKRSILVCKAFHGLKPSSTKRLLVAHKNDVPHDDRPSNLYWATYSQNSFDKIRNSGHSKCILNGRSKLSEKEVLEIRRLYDGKCKNQYELADEFHVCQRSISLIVRRKTWKHV